MGMSDDFIEVIFLQVRFNRETSSETEKYNSVAMLKAVQSKVRSKVSPGQHPSEIFLP